MVVARNPLTRVGRIAAAIIGAVWLAGGALAFIRAVGQGELLLGVLGVLAVAIGLFYGIAAWRGRPWKWK